MIHYLFLYFCSCKVRCWYTEISLYWKIMKSNSNRKRVFPWVKYTSQHYSISHGNVIPFFILSTNMSMIHNNGETKTCFSFMHLQKIEEILTNQYTDETESVAMCFEGK